MTWRRCAVYLVGIHLARTAIWFLIEDLADRRDPRLRYRP